MFGLLQKLGQALSVQQEPSDRPNQETSKDGSATDAFLALLSAVSSSPADPRHPAAEVKDDPRDEEPQAPGLQDSPSVVQPTDQRLKAQPETSTIAEGFNHIEARPEAHRPNPVVIQRPTASASATLGEAQALSISETDAQELSPALDATSFQKKTNPKPGQDTSLNVSTALGDKELQRQPPKSDLPQRISTSKAAQPALIRDTGERGSEPSSNIKARALAPSSATSTKAPFTSAPKLTTTSRIVPGNQATCTHLVSQEAAASNHSKEKALPEVRETTMTTADAGADASQRRTETARSNTSSLPPGPLAQQSSANMDLPPKASGQARTHWTAIKSPAPKAPSPRHRQDTKVAIAEAKATPGFPKHAIQTSNQACASCEAPIETRDLDQAQLLQQGTEALARSAPGDEPNRPSFAAPIAQVATDAPKAPPSSHPTSHRATQAGPTQHLVHTLRQAMETKTTPHDLRWTDPEFGELALRINRQGDELEVWIHSALTQTHETLKLHHLSIAGELALDPEQLRFESPDSTSSQDKEPSSDRSPFSQPEAGGKPTPSKSAPKPDQAHKHAPHASRPMISSGSGLDLIA